MTTSTPETARANRLGERCPSWCTQDHDRIVLEATDHRPEAVYAHAHAGSPVTNSGPFAPRVWVAEYGYGARVFAASLSHTLNALPGQQAEDLAGFLEQLAGYTPEQLRQMAADVRTAAAIAGEGQ